MNAVSNSTKILLGLLAILFLLSGCGKSKTASHHADDHHGHMETETQNLERGPHNGRLLHDGDFTVEIAIYESGVPPEFRVWFTKNKQPLDPSKIALSVKLKRFAGVEDEHRFSIENGYLRSQAEVYEPHSFDVEIVAEYAGQRHRWTYESHEGRTQINAAMAKASGIEVQAVGPGKIAEHVALYGTIQADATRVRSVVARFPGVIREVGVAIGDRVSAGQTLARVESNESLQTYSVTAPIAGAITQRHANPGETASGDALFEIADYSQVWATLNVFPRDRARIRAQMPVHVRATDGDVSGEGIIAAINAASNTSNSPSTSPLSNTAPLSNTSLMARVVLDNRESQWTPGQFVNAEVKIADNAAALVVPVSALQTFRDWDVVFVNDGDIYQAQPVELGNSDGVFVEIKSGLSTGMNIVVNNSYLIKADIEKSGASHDH